MAKMGKAARKRTARPKRRGGYKNATRAAYRTIARSAGVAVPFVRPGPAPAAIAHRKLRYCETIHPSAQAPSTGFNHVWRLNGAYDPNESGAGHQPLGWDQMDAFYNRYRVVGATITAEVCNRDTTNTTWRTVCGISITPTTTFKGTTSGPDACQEQPYTVYRTLGSPDQAAGKLKIVRKLPNFKPYFGDSYLTDDSYSALMSAVPNNEIHAIFWARPSDPANGSVSMTVNFTITYDVIFFDPKSNYAES